MHDDVWSSIPGGLFNAELLRTLPRLNSAESADARHDDVRSLTFYTIEREVPSLFLSPLAPFLPLVKSAPRVQFTAQRGLLYYINNRVFASSSSTFGRLPDEDGGGDGSCGGDDTKNVRASGDAIRSADCGKTMNNRSSEGCISLLFPLSFSVFLFVPCFSLHFYLLVSRDTAA